MTEVFIENMHEERSWEARPGGEASIAQASATEPAITQISIAQAALAQASILEQTTAQASIPQAAKAGDLSALPANPSVSWLSRLRSVLPLRAWMLVLAADLAALVAPAMLTPEHAKGYLLFAAVATLLLADGGRYRARLYISVLDELPSLLGRLLAASALVGTLFALLKLRSEVTEFLAGALASIGLLVLGRLLTGQLILLGRRRGLITNRTVLVGGGPVAVDLAAVLQQYPQYGLSLIGYVDDSHSPLSPVSAKRLGSVADLDTVVRETTADVVLIADGEVSEPRLLEVLQRPGCARVDLMSVPRLNQFCRQEGIGDHIGSIPVTRIRMPRLRGPAWAIKRGCDVVVAAVLLILTAPVLAACALAVRIESGPGILFRQERVGRDGVSFTCLKLRSMRPSNAAESATLWSVAQDNRIGPVGRFLRGTSFDELPQLWNVFRGDMTLVGPRPERPHFVHKFSAEYPRYENRHRVPAGLTGLAQVSGLRGDTPIADRTRFDNYYIENWSLWLDFKILMRTFAEVFLARGR